MLIAAFALGVFAGFLLFPWVVWKSWRALARKALYAREPSWLQSCWRVASGLVGWFGRFTSLSDAVNKAVNLRKPW